ncbi:MAG: hypothetical protein JWO38_7635 [Gemmataceae bacterium]|nr:hypothetical protein [Gemmataceae bacterium]
MNAQAGYVPPTGGGPNTGPPPGYRSVGGTGQDPPPAPDRTGPVGGGGGRVMYFHKPADALAPDTPPDAGAVAMAAPAGPAGVPDVPAPTPGALPPPTRATVADRPIPAPEVAFTPPILPTPVPLPFAPTAAQPPAPAQPFPSEPAPRPEDLKKPPPGVTELPKPAQIFRMYDDATLRRFILEAVAERLNAAEQVRKPGEKKKEYKPEDLAPFPPLPAVTPPGVVYAPKTEKLPPGKMVYEPMFVIHRRLHFEEKNAERYGWDFGFIQPFVSTISFYKNALLWPNSLASGFEVGFWDTSAGKCLPGSPTPYYLYPPGLTITGVLAEASVVTGTVALTHPARLLIGVGAPP